MTKTTAADKTARSIRKFNPGTLQSDSELIDQFVVRVREFELVQEVLRGNIDTPSCQHVLIVAPRGRGKTMLLARAAAALRTEDEFTETLLPVRFMEESHEVFNIADFWLETLFHVAREIAAEYAELARELRKTHTDLSGRWGEQAIGDHARAAVLGAAERIDKKLVLIVENLQTLFGNVDDDFGWQLRGVLQSEPRIVLLASATSRFEGLDDPRQAFFELFRIITLKPLTTEECSCLWETVTGHRVGGRDIRPLEILTGGNCRLLAIVAGFSEHRSLRLLMEELVRLVDENTEYFRGHLEILPKSERRVYIAVIDLWQPSSTSEIAARARMDIRVASTMLGRLVERGAVLPQSSERGSKRFYTAAEPLYSIYYKLRRERDEAAVVENLIRFMMAFYDSFMLYGIFDRLRSEANDVPALYSGVDRVLGKRPVDLDLRSRMVWDRLNDISMQLWNQRRAEAELRFQDDIEAAFEKKAYEKVIELVDRHVDAGWGRRSEGLQEHDAVYLAHIRADAYFGLGEYARTISIGDEVLDRFRDSRDVFILYRSSLVLYRKVLAHSELGDHSGTIASARDVADWFGHRKDSVFPEVVAWVTMCAARAQEALGNYDAAISLLDDILERYEESEMPEAQRAVFEALIDKANIVRRRKNDDQRALDIYNEAIQRYGDSEVPAIEGRMVEAFMNRAFTHGDIGDFEGEIASYDTLIEREEESEMHEARAIALAFQALRLAEVGRIEEALTASAELERRFGASDEEWNIWLLWMGMAARAIALTVRQDAGALDAFRAAYAIYPTNNEVSTRGMIRVVLNLVAVGARESDLAKILLNDKVKSRAIAPLVAALCERTGETVRAPVEVLDVAADIQKDLEDKSAKGVLVAF